MNDKRGGMYWFSGDPYISVTTALQVIAKPALNYWYGKMVYAKLVKDPTKSEEEALAAPKEAAGKAANRGKIIHSLIETFKQNGELKDVPEEMRGYAEAFYSWINNNDVLILDSEKKVKNEEYKFGGTLDMIAEVNGRRRLLDFKTNKDATIYHEAHIQVSAYRECLGEDIEGLIIALGSNGQFTEQSVVPCFPTFIHCLGLYVNINKKKLLDWGWKGNYDL